MNTCSHCGELVPLVFQPGALVEGVLMIEEEATCFQDKCLDRKIWQCMDCGSRTMTFWMPGCPCELLGNKRCPHISIPKWGCMECKFKCGNCDWVILSKSLEGIHPVLECECGYKVPFTKQYAYGDYQKVHALTQEVVDKYGDVIPERLERVVDYTKKEVRYAWVY